MQIKQRLRVNTVVSACAAVCIGAVLVLSLFRIHEAVKAQKLADDIIQNLFERTTFEGDFLRTGSERAQTQWRSRHERIALLLEEAAAVFQEAEARKNIAEMTRDHASSWKLFHALMEHQGKSVHPTDTAAISQDVARRFQTQLIMRSYETAWHARNLQDAGNRLLLSVLTVAGGWIAGIIVIAVAIATLNAWTLERTISRRIESLREGATVIGSGGLDHRIDMSGTDEFTELSHSFNQMAVKLRQSYRILEDEINDRKRIEETLRQSREDLKRAQEVAHTGSWRLNVRKNELLWSEENWRIFGLPADTALTYETFLGTIHPDDRTYVDERWQAALQGEPYDIDHRILVGETVKWVRETATLEFDADGALLGGFGTTQDITERKVREERLRKLNRMLRALGHSSKAMMHAAHEEAYLREVCGIIVEDCGHSLVWIGYAEDDAAKTVRPVASAGFEAGYLEELKITWADTERGQGPTGRAIRTGQVSICRNMLTDPCFAPWREEAVRRGYVSSIVLPLIIDGRSLGVLNIYSGQADPFEEDEVRLLQQLADDVAYGIAMLRVRAEREQAEAAARRLAQFPEQNPNPVLRISSLGALLYANAAARAWLACEGVQDDPAATDVLGGILVEAAQSDGVVRREIAGPGGRAMLFSAVRPAGESYVNIYGLDISERKLAEKSLHESEERLRLALSAAQMATFDWDIIHNKRTWSDDVHRLMGTSPDTFTGTAEEFMQVIHPEDRRNVDTALVRAVEHSSQYEAEYRTVWPDGSVHHIAARGKVHRDDEDRAVLLTGVCWDITGRKVIEEALMKSHEELEARVLERTSALVESNRELELEIKERMVVEEKLIASLEAIHDLYDNAPCGYHSLDKDGRIIRINDTELRWLGYQRGEVLGRMVFSDLITPESCAVFSKSFPLLKETGQINDLEFEMVRKDGSIMPVLLSATAVKDPDGNFVMTRSTVFDITERKKAEQEALRAAHLASIGELAAGVAHEINNPINSIINYAQILMNKGDTTRKEYEFTGEIVKEGERIATIVSSLLSFSRKTDEVRRPVSVKELLTSTLTLTSAQLQKEGIHLALMVPDSLPRIMAVPQQIQQVILNMISNARYALNQRYPVPDDAKILEIRGDTITMDDRPMVRITFLDYGTGIPANVLDKVTEPFFTTKPGQQGTGLGLSICSNIAMKHGGIISITSIEGDHTEVSVMLPAERKE